MTTQIKRNESQLISVGPKSLECNACAPHSLCQLPQKQVMHSRSNWADWDYWRLQNRSRIVSNTLYQLLESMMGQIRDKKPVKIPHFCPLLLASRSWELMQFVKHLPLSLGSVIKHTITECTMRQCQMATVLCQKLENTKQTRQPTKQKNISH